MEDIKKVTERIRKLLALATSTNEHEAALAAQRAHEYLVRYNLDLQVVQREPNRYIEQDVDRRTFRRTEEKYVDAVLKKHFFVEVYTFRQPGPLYRKNESKSSWYETHTVLVGTAANVEIAQHVRAYLLETFYRLWCQYRRSRGAEPRLQQGYYYGLQRGLQEKLTAQKKTICDSLGLVLVEDTKLQEHLREIGVTDGRNHHFRNTEAIADGKTDGKKIEIRKSLNESSVQTSLQLPKGKP